MIIQQCCVQKYAYNIEINYFYCTIINNFYNLYRLNIKFFTLFVSNNIINVNKNIRSMLVIP
ncbi:hypothetical protein PFMALIP_05488 [Plasmodium falciparum MaliPS096_E11]|uniref:Uncharacterized protein n=2 Tax=Plasmodium falciparum TaxID=5833 RepID=A0A024WZD8_PLAFC|nr:hypothetical protein PFMALIP_05488 [Plasmodium falciparum MaliPS096_E11]ETW58632.1 hypothetical protein PFMC_05729 [Plasmodium falciparum CAMP/Malaysia]